MFVYPYKTIKSGKFTKYSISITEDSKVLIEYSFKGKKRRQEVFETAVSIKESGFPKQVIESALWARNDARGLGLGS